jgi:O-methyltransferase
LLDESRLRAGEFEQPQVEQYRSEFAAQKLFMQRAFQALAYNGIDGDYVEFGCCGANTFALAWGAAQLTGHDAHLWAFDSFEGLPPSDHPVDDHVGWAPGAMAMSEAAFVATAVERGVPTAAFTTVPGFFADSLASADGLPDRIAFAYIDCDLYSSTMDVLRFLEPRLRHGMVIGCDDYYCYSTEHASGERQALAELFDGHDRWRLLPFVQWSWHGMSFIVESRSEGPPGIVGW